MQIKRTQCHPYTTRHCMCSLNCICNQLAHTRPQKKARNNHKETFHCPCCHVGSSKIFIHACTGQRHGRGRRAELCCCSGGMRWTSLICVCSSPTHQGDGFCTVPKYIQTVSPVVFWM